MDDVGFRSCVSSDEVVDRLSSQIHLYRISPIQQTVEKFPDDEMRRVVEFYEREKDCFLRGTRVVKFQATPQKRHLPEDMCEVQFVVTKAMAHEKRMNEIDIIIGSRIIWNLLQSSDRDDHVS